MRLGEVGFDPSYEPAGMALESGPMKTRELADRFQDWQERATERAREVGTATDQYVRDNTWTSIACAALLGCVIGYLLAGRNDD